jgi:hypothetical protein
MLFANRFTPRIVLGSPLLEPGVSITTIAVTSGGRHIRWIRSKGWSESDVCVGELHVTIPPLMRSKLRRNLQIRLQR